MHGVKDIIPSLNGNFRPSTGAAACLSSKSAVETGSTVPLLRPLRQAIDRGHQESRFDSKITTKCWLLSYY